MSELNVAEWSCTLSNEQICRPKLARLPLLALRKSHLYHLTRRHTPWQLSGGFGWLELPQVHVLVFVVLQRADVHLELLAVVVICKAAPEDF